jgi:4-amino-4-deoxy-L-arabinose transferase-like glycosyltransferase
MPFFTHNRLDAAVYHDMASGFVDGADLWGSEVIHMSPLYSGLLAVLYAAFGPSPWAPRVFQLMLGLATVALIWSACRRLFKPRWAIVGGVVTALYGPSIFFEHQLSVATLSTTLCAALLYAGLFAFGSPKRAFSRWATVGILWGLAVLARPNALLLIAPLTYLAMTSVKRHRFSRMIFLVVAGAFIILPVTLRNYIVAGEAVLVTDAGGMNFYIGNGPDANGTFNIPPEIPGASNAPAQFREYRRLAEQDSGRKLTSKEMDAYWYNRTFDYIKGNPGRWIALLAKKTLMFLHPRELSNTHNYDFHRRLSPTLALPFIQYGPLAIFGVLGTVLMLFTARPETRFVSLVAVVCFAGLVAFFVLAHYRIIVVPAFIIASVYSAERLYEWLRGKYWLGVAVAAAFAGAMLFLGTISFFDPNTTDEYFKLGYAYHVQGDADKAAEAYGEALRLSPNHTSSLKNFAMLLESRGLNDQALKFWRRLYAAADGAGLTDYRDLAVEHIQMLLKQKREQGRTSAAPGSTI